MSDQQFLPNIPISYGKHKVTEADIKAVVDVLRGDFLTQGPLIKKFEEAFASYIGCKYAVAVSNGTAALHISASTLGVVNGSRIITTPITFVASANSVRFCGGEMYFADIDPDTYLLDINKVRELIEKHPSGYFQGIIPVDFAGKAIDLEQFRKLADEHGLWLLEDACHAPGGFFTDSKGQLQKCGNGNYADLSIFSFHPAKHIACGEGGIVTTNNEEHYKRLLRLRSHGITSNPEEFQNSIEFAIGGQFIEQNLETGYPGWYMEMQSLGYNYRITDIQCGLGISQLARAEEGLKRRKEIANVYDEFLADKPYVLKKTRLDPGHALHLYVGHFRNRLGLYKYLKDSSINIQIHYIPAYKMPYYKNQLRGTGTFPESEKYYDSCISLPIYPSLTDQELTYVIEKIDSFYK